jgi:hypothetical protein
VVAIGDAGHRGTPPRGIDGNQPITVTTPQRVLGSLLVVFVSLTPNPVALRSDLPRRQTYRDVLGFLLNLATAVPSGELSAFPLRRPSRLDHGATQRPRAQ